MQFGEPCSKEQKMPSCMKISPPWEESVCSPVACHIWRALGPDTATPLCSDICRISSSSFHTEEKNRRWVQIHSEEEFSFSLISHHLHSTDVLLLLHIDVCKIQPDITDLCCGLSDLGKDIPCLSEITLVCQHSTCVTQQKHARDELKQWWVNTSPLSTMSTPRKQSGQMH